MELNQIPQNPNNWGNVADLLNENSGKIEAETAKLNNATTKFKGYFTTSTALSAKWPSPLVGDTAWVGATYPGVVYRCNVAGAWLATADVPPSNTVNLSEYATQDAVSNEFASVRSDLSETTGKLTELEGQSFIIEHDKRFLANGYTDSLTNYACTSIIIGDGSTYTFPNINTSGCAYKVFKYISDSEGQELTGGSWSNAGTSIAINAPFVVTFSNGDGVSASDYDFLENDYVIGGLKIGLKERVDEIESEVDANTASIQQIENDIEVNEEKYISVQLSIQENKEFNFITLTIDNSKFQCAVVDVSEGEKYLVSGFNQSSTLPLAIAYNSLTNDKIRLLNIGTNITGVDEEATIPAGYDKMAINGHISAPVGLKKYSSVNLKIKDVVEQKSIIKANYPLFVAITDITNGNVISVNKRFNADKDVVWKFGNKPSNANNNFDFKEIGFVNRGMDVISDKYLSNDGYEYLLGHSTDYILAIQCGANNNANGDFPTNTSLFTGGFHGYNNISDITASATMREVSKKVYADGKELSTGDKTYCSKCKIVVINNIQGSNTEKADGSGREIIEQKIIVDADENNMIVSVEYKALEDVILYGISGLAQYLDFDKVRFIGSHSRLSEYNKGTLVRVENDDKGTVAIRNYGNEYFFETGIDKTYGIGDSYYNQSSPNALITTANKGYFDLIVHSNPLSLSQGESVQVKGYFKFEPLS